MKILLNNSEVNIEDKNLTTLFDLISHLKNKIIAKGHKITRILIGDTEVTADDKSLKLSDCSNISITSADPYKLADDGLNNMKDYFSHLLPILNKCAENFRTKGEEEANKFYAEVLNALKLIFDLIGGIESMLSINYSDITLSGENFSDKILKLQQILASMHEAQKNSDWVQLADLIEYELTENLVNWQNLLPSIREEIKKIGLNKISS